MNISKRNNGSLPVVALAVLGILATSVFVLTHKFSAATNNTAVLAESSTEFTISNSNAIANQDGSTLTLGPTKAWYGNGQSTTSSYLGLNFTGGQIPAGAQIKSATLEMTAVGAWISVSTSISGDTSGKGNFSTSSKPSDRSLTSSTKNYSDDEKWEADSVYSYDVTGPVQEAVNAKGSQNIGLIIKGTGGQWGRKEIYGNPSTGKSPKLVIVFTTSSTTTPTASSTPVVTPSPTPTVRATATATATASPITTPTTAPSGTPVMTMTGMPSSVPQSGGSGGGTSAIYGAVSADLLGTCSSTVHDRYVVRGPDGMLYRTWHPQTVPVDANNPNGAKCTFAHEHGANPATSNIYRGPVPFDYVPRIAGMDEPHGGFKCFVQNRGMTNDEGGSALHDSYFCFHMGTGGAGRFTTRFHSFDFHILTSGGARMDLVGLADVGNVGTICNSPREERTVMGLGCKVDSAYEIWQSTFNVSNQGNSVATAIAISAVFDPITVMDPSDLTKAIPTWDPITDTQIFKFNDDHSGYRGCDRESYVGPMQWSNRTGSATYYTDVYGNVVNGGPIKQTISLSDTKDAGALTQFGSLIMTYKGGNDPQSQFKYHQAFCEPGLGLKN